MASVSIRHDRRQGKRRFHEAWAPEERSARPAPFSTACDQRREPRPLVSGTRPIGPNAPPPTELIHAPIGTPKPDFARVTTSFGSGSVGAAASAALPAPSLIAGIAGARLASRTKSTRGT